MAVAPPGSAGGRCRGQADLSGRHQHLGFTAGSPADHGPALELGDGCDAHGELAACIGTAENRL
jgi:hypothetical protein